MEDTTHDKADTSSVLSSHSSAPSICSSSSSSSSSSSIDEIPVLKYSRPKLIALSEVSASTFHPKYAIFATHLGMVLIYTIDFNLVRTFRAHRASVLLVYTDGEFFATGSMDGTVVIGSITDEKDITAYDFQRPIHSVILEKNFSHSRGFILGGMGGKVVYSSKSWLGKRLDVVIDEGNGPIVGLTRVDDLLFWMNDDGITAWNNVSKQKVGVIERPSDAPRLDEYWPRWAFPETDRMVVAWGNYVWQLRILVAKKTAPLSYIPLSVSFRANPHTNAKQVEVEVMYKMESLIAGIVPFSKHDQWLVLTHNPDITDSDGRREYQYPDIQLVNSATGEVEWEEEIGLKDIANLGLNDYHLYCLDDKYYIVSARDLVLAEEVDMDDRIQWYIDHDEFDQVWQLCGVINIPPLKRLNYGIQHVDNLVKDDWQAALNFLSQVLAVDESKLVVRDDKSTIALTALTSDDAYVAEVVMQWDQWLALACKTGHYAELTNVIPTTTKLAIDGKVYTDILRFWLHTDEKTFATLISVWDLDLYRVADIEREIMEQLEENDSHDLRQALAHIYVEQHEPAKAVPQLIHLRNPDLVAFVTDHNLLDQFFNQLPTMLAFRLGNDRSLNTEPLADVEHMLAPDMALLVKHRHEVTPGRIVKLFTSKNFLMLTFVYLEQLRAKDEYAASRFGNELVKLFVEFRRPLLLPYLAKHDTEYDLDGAISICEQANFTEELVYLLGKVGDTKRAMKLIIEDLNNPEAALDFAKRHQDRECWSFLLDEAVTDENGGRPNFIKVLIEQADDKTSAYYDPLDILKRMPASIQVQGLTQLVVKFTKNNGLNLVLNQLILDILHKQAETTSNGYRHCKLVGVDGESMDIDVTQFVGIGVAQSLLPTTEVTINYVLSPLPIYAPPFTNLPEKLRWWASVAHDSVGVSPTPVGGDVE